MNNLQYLMQDFSRSLNVAMQFLSFGGVRYSGVRFQYRQRQEKLPLPSKETNASVAWPLAAVNRSTALQCARQDRVITLPPRVIYLEQIRLKIVAFSL